MAVGCEQKSLNLTPFFCLQCQQKGDDVNAKRAGWRHFATFRKICMEKGGHSTKRLRFRGSAIGARLKLDCAKRLYRKKQLGCSCVWRDVETTRARPGAKHASKPQNKQPASWSSGRNNKKQSWSSHWSNAKLFTGRHGDCAPSHVYSRWAAVNICVCVTSYSNWVARRKLQASEVEPEKFNFLASSRAQCVSFLKNE